MNNFLFKLFIKDYKDVNNPEVRERYGKFAGIVGIFSNALLCLGKVIIGLFSGSISIIADGINNLMDASSSAITFAGFRLSSLPEDQKHPYGHKRFEEISGIIVAMLVLIAGVELFQSAVTRIFHPEPVDPGNLTITLLVLSIFIKVWQAVFNLTIAKKINSVTLKATGTDSRNDVISTSAVLVGLLLTRFSGLQLDGYIGTGVALFIIYSGITLMKETISVLLGEAPDEELVSDIIHLIRSYPSVKGIHDLIIHSYGPGRNYASVHIEVDADENLVDIHNIIDEIEYRILTEYKVDITAHIDPISSDDTIQNSLTLIISKIAESVCGLSHVHDLKLVPQKDHIDVIFDIVTSPDCEDSEEKLYELFDSELKRINSRYHAVINFDKNYSRTE